ncbi:MAG: phosphate--acyl-ACP acyltransferase, partial [Clostridia bacterium]
PNIVDGKSAAIVDGGANVDCTLPMLKEFAIMGDAFAKSMFGIKEPVVCLMNNGVEEEKGNVLAKEAYQMLKTLKVNFGGNIEPREILFGGADAVVCDGFVGNAAIKGAEGMASAIFKDLSEKVKKGGLKVKLGALMLKPALRGVKARLNSDTIGGAPFLGVNHVVIKAHGSSNKVAFENAIFTAKRMVEDNLVDNIRKGLANNTDNAADVNAE